MSLASRFDPYELDALRLQTPVSRIFREAGVKLDPRGLCCCPFHHDKTPSCSVNDKTQRFRCFGCGAHGDVFDAVMMFKACSFPEAVKHLGGTQPLSPVQREEIVAQAAEAARERDAEDDRKRAKARRLFGGGLPIAGTHAARYLEARGISVNPRMSGDLRFHPALKYFPGTTEALGEFPAMLAAIRDVDGAIIGCHRTYLAPDTPTKAILPGKLPAKKVEGLLDGGMIWLSPRDEGNSIIIGEGIESALSGYQLAGDIGASEDVAVAAAVSLGNLAGCAAGRVRHPKDSDKTIPNGVPDHNRPGMILPAHIDDRVFILQDGDSEKIFTAAQIATAGRRFEDQNREVWVCPAPDGFDHNDALMALIREAA